MGSGDSVTTVSTADIASHDTERAHAVAAHFIAVGETGRSKSKANWLE